jgi:hypothetical protein
MKIVFEIESWGQKMFFLYTIFVNKYYLGALKVNKLFSDKKSSSEKYIDIILRQKKFNKLSSEKNSFWRNIKNKILYRLKK